MNVTCPNCATLYRVDPAKVPEAGVRARCAVCSAVFPVSREQQRGAGTPVEATVERCRGTVGALVREVSDQGFLVAGAGFEPATFGL